MPASDVAWLSSADHGLPSPQPTSSSYSFSSAPSSHDLHLHTSSAHQKHVFFPSPLLAVHLFPRLSPYSSPPTHTRICTLHLCPFLSRTSCLHDYPHPRQNSRLSSRKAPCHLLLRCLSLSRFQSIPHLSLVPTLLEPSFAVAPHARSPSPPLADPPRQLIRYVHEIRH